MLPHTILILESKLIHAGPLLERGWSFYLSIYLSRGDDGNFTSIYDKK